MKKLMFIALLGATVGSAWCMAGRQWSDQTGNTDYTGATVDPDKANTLGRLLRAFKFEEETGSLAKESTISRQFESAVRHAAESGDFSQLDQFGKEHATLNVHGATLPQWIELAKQNRVPLHAK